MATMTRRMNWRTADVDAGLERQQERQLARYEGEQDRLQAEQDRFEACECTPLCDFPCIEREGLNLGPCCAGCPELPEAGDW